MVASNEDVIKVEETVANLAADLKNQMMAYNLPEDRFAYMTSGSVMKFVSNDVLQGLLAGAQTYTGIKSWSALATFLADIINAGVLSHSSTPQTVSSDNDTLLAVGNTSFLHVTTATTGNPTIYTVGMEAGKIDGHIVHIIVKTPVDAWSFEINDSVPASASIVAKDGTLPITIDTTRASISFIWYADDSTWREL